LGWAALHIAKLTAGETVRFRPRGHSMKGHIESGDLVVVEPLSGAPQVGDIVLARVRGVEYLHFVRAIDGERVQIGNARGFINGWTSRHQIYGRLIAVNPD
jgi:signal peptidase I